MSPRSHYESLAQANRVDHIKAARNFVVVGGIITLLSGLYRLSLSNSSSITLRKAAGAGFAETSTMLAGLELLSAAVLLVAAAVINIRPVVTCVTSLLSFLALNALVGFLNPVAVVERLLMKLIVIVFLAQGIRAALAYERVKRLGAEPEPRLLAIPANGKRSKLRDMFIRLLARFPIPFEALPYLIGAVGFLAATFWSANRLEMLLLSGGCLLSAAISLAWSLSSKEFQMVDEGLRLTRGNKLLPWSEFTRCFYGKWSPDPQSAAELGDQKVVVQFGNRQIRLKPYQQISNAELYRQLCSILLSRTPRLAGALQEAYQTESAQHPANSVVAAKFIGPSPSMTILERFLISYLGLFALGAVGLMSFWEPWTSRAVCLAGLVLFVAIPIISVMLRLARKPPGLNEGGLVISPSGLTLDTKRVKGHLNWGDLHQQNVFLSEMFPIWIRLRLLGTRLLIRDDYELPLWCIFQRCKAYHAEAMAVRQQIALTQERNRTEGRGSSVGLNGDAKTYQFGGSEIAAAAVLGCLLIAGLYFAYQYYQQNRIYRDQPRSAQEMQTPQGSPSATGLPSEADRIALEKELQKQLAIQKEPVEAAQEEAGLLENISSIVNARNEFLSTEPNGMLMPHPGKTGQGLSWRVHFLPYLGQKSLYSRFKLDEPWDSPHNLELLQLMPTEYGVSSQGKTRLRSLLNIDGQGAPYIKATDIADGIDQTALFVWVGRDQSTEWTKPDDLENAWQDKSLLQQFGWSTGSQGASGRDQSTKGLGPLILCNNSVLGWQLIASEQNLKSLLTARGGELVRFTNSDVDGLRVIDVRQPTVPIDQNIGDDLVLAQRHIEQIAQAFGKLREALSSKPPLKLGSRRLSWRVYLLPFLGEKELYDKFHLDEPWDSDHNLSLIFEAPAVFGYGSSPGRTRFLMPVVGADQNSSTTLANYSIRLKDDPGLTTFMYWAAPHNASYWTQPDERTLDDANVHRSLGWTEQDNVLAATVAGKSITLPGDLHRSKWLAINSYNGNEVFSLEEALVRPSGALRLKPSVAPATPIEGLVELPKVPAIKLNDSSTSIVNPEDITRFETIASAIQVYSGRLRQSPLFAKKADGKPSELSWRVHILPYMDKKPLFDTFALDEPWNSEKNLAAAANMPAIYGTAANNQKTDVCLLAGKQCLLGTPQDVAFGESANNTIMLAQVSEKRRVPWTKPADLEWNESFKVSNWVEDHPFRLVVLGNRKVIPFSSKLPNAVFNALATTSTSELIDAGTVARLSYHLMGQPIVPIANREVSAMKRMQEIARAIEKYELNYRSYPPGKGTGQSATQDIPLENYCLSWRVHLLPQLGHQELFNRFRLTEPWDSPHNLQLISEMPDVFRDEDDPASSSTTRIQVVMGSGTPYPDIGEAPTQASIKDSKSSTLMFLRVPAELAVPWTQPADFRVNLPTDDLSRLRSPEGLLYMTYDGGFHQLGSNFDTTVMQSLIRPDDASAFKGDLMMK